MLPLPTSKNESTIEGEWLDIGATVDVVVTVPGIDTDTNANGVTIKINGKGTDMTQAGDVKGSYTVVTGANSITVEATDKQ